MNAADVVHDAILTHQVDLAGFEASQKNAVRKVLRALEGEIVAAIAKSDPTSRVRLNALLKQTREIIAASYRRISREQREGLAAVAAMQGTIASRALSAAISVPLKSVALPATAIKTLIEKPIVLGRPAAAWWAQQSTGLQDRFAAQMQIGYAAGEDIAKLARRVRGTRESGLADGLMAVSRAQAEGLVRTSVQSVANSARLLAFEEMSDIGDTLVWVSVLDGRTSTICLSLSGLKWQLPDYKPIGHSKAFPGPTSHWNCFTGEVPVASPASIRRLYRRSYSGELVTVETSNGRRITATPNHPILTSDGWRAIRTLAVGDDLLCKKGTGTATPASPHNQTSQALFAELAEATSEFCGMVSVQVPMSRPDFHGDGTDKEISQVWTYSELSDEGHASLAQRLPGFHFQRPDLDPTSSLHSESTLEQRFPLAGHSANSGMCRQDGGLLPARPAGVQVLNARASDSGVQTPPAQCLEADSKLPSDFAGGELIGDIESDRICMVLRSEAVAVLVHNIETTTGWYLASGIISHNCRSTQILLPKAYEQLADKEITLFSGKTYEKAFKSSLKKRGLTPEQIEKATSNQRASMDGTVPADVTFEGWLKSKSPSFLDRMLGKSVAALWRDGKISANDLTNDSAQPRTAAQLAARVGGVFLPENTSPLAAARAQIAAAQTSGSPDLQQALAGLSGKLPEVSLLAIAKEQAAAVTTAREEIQTEVQRLEAAATVIRAELAAAQTARAKAERQAEKAESAEAAAKKEVARQKAAVKAASLTIPRLPKGGLRANGKPTVEVIVETEKGAPDILARDFKLTADQFTRIMEERSGLPITYAAFTQHKDRLVMNFAGDGWTMKRTWQGGIMFHDKFQILADRQNDGLAKKLLRAQLDIYDHAGINRVELVANLQVGGYAWARYGFVPTKESWASLVIKLRPHALELDEDINAILADPNPLAIRRLARHKDGKGLLLGTTWEGSIDLSDAESYSYLRTYIN